MDMGIDESIETSYSTEATSDPANFECNICLELAQEPIVTLCGHLYCWPCLYQWLRLHSHSQECPVCKAIVHEEKLVPIYGRGKSNSDPRSRTMPGIDIPNRPIWYRTPTPRHVHTNYVPPNEVDPMGFMPMAAARFGHMTLSAIFGALPGIFNFQAYGSHDATVYGSTSGVVPFLFSGSFHGGYVHGFHHYHSFHMEWRPVILKVFLVIVGFLLLMRLILA